MWITRFKKFYEFQKARFLLIFQHFIDFCLTLMGFYITINMLFSERKAYFYAPNC